MRERRPTSAYVLLAVLLAGLVGIVATLLVGSAPKAPVAHAGELVISLPDQVWGLVLLSPLLVGFAVLILQRLTAKAMSHSRRTLVQFGVAFVICVLFVYAASLATHSSGSVGVVSPSPGSNNTTTPPVNNSGTPPPNSSGLGISGTSLTIPTWGLVALVAALSTTVAVLALPGALSLFHGRRRPGPGGPEPSEQDRIEAQNAIAEASRALEQGADPRTTIVRLYLRLLLRLGPRLGEVDHFTAEEIRTTVLAPLRVRPDAAVALTRLFEEARYSLHPMGSEAAGRCREALAAVEADLARAKVPVAS